MAKNGCYGGGSYGWGGGDGCCITAFILLGSLVLVGCGVTKGVKALTHKDSKPKIEQVANKHVKQQDVIAYNNVHTL